MRSPTYGLGHPRWRYSAQRGGERQWGGGAAPVAAVLVDHEQMEAVLVADGPTVVVNQVVARSPGSGTLASKSASTRTGAKALTVGAHAHGAPRR